MKRAVNKKLYRKGIIIMLITAITFVIFALIAMYIILPYTKDDSTLSVFVIAFLLLYGTGGIMLGLNFFAKARGYNSIDDPIMQDISHGIQDINNNIVSTNQMQTSNLDELPKLKKLLDDGIITQEEFELKKKQLLGL